MATTAIKGFGTLLKRGDAATPTEAFTAVGEALTISGPSYSAEAIDVTNMDSPNNAHEKIGEGLVDGGEISIEGNYIYDDAQQDGILTDMYAGTSRNWKIVLSNSQEIAFTGILTGWELSGMEKGSQVRFSATMAVTGKPTTP